MYVLPSVTNHQRYLADDVEDEAHWLPFGCHLLANWNENSKLAANISGGYRTIYQLVRVCCRNCKTFMRRFDSDPRLQNLL